MSITPAASAGSRVSTLGTDRPIEFCPEEPLVESEGALDTTVGCDDQQDDIAQSRAFMTEFGVPEDTQDELITNALAGVLPLSEDPSAEPVSTESGENSDSTFQVLRYSDGSLAVREIEKSTAASGTRGVQAVTGCSHSGTTHFTTYSGCKIHYRTVVFSYGFYASFRIYGSGNDSVISAGSKFQEYSIGHSRLDWRLRIINQTEDPGNNAHIELSIRYLILPSVGEIQKGVRLRVGSNKYCQKTNTSNC
ncbi:hypothetical protein ACFO6V_15445 [Promicromonospora alba]|uniref:Uncharacterized protein n=1 Tax=Promicromonospora alba TaxID=1616110 RepID=A0ABV9HKI8_9MICO